MKKENKPSGIVIFVAVLAALIFLTHCDRLNDVPGVSVDEPEITVDIGDLHYQS